MAAPKYFADSTQARQFLASRIIEEAHRRHDELSAVEMKMLRLSDASSGLPEGDQSEHQSQEGVGFESYVAKIRRLSTQAYRYDRRNSPQDLARWKEAIAILKWHDPELASMVEVPRSNWDFVWLILAALFTVIVGLCLVLCLESAKAWLDNNIPHETRDNFLAVSIAIFVVGAYVLKYTQLGKTLRERLGNLADRLIDRFQ